MKIKEVIIHNYKSISHDCTLIVDTKVTPLVGASETGKTNILEALNKFFSPKAFDESNVCTFSDLIRDDSHMVSVKFRLEDRDKEPISTIDQRLVEANEFILRKQNNGHYVLAESDLGERKAKEPQPPKRLTELHDKIRQEFESANTVFVKFYDSLPEATPDHQKAQKAFDALTKYIPLSGFPIQSSEAREQRFLGMATTLLERFAAKLQVLTDVPDELTLAITNLINLMNEAATLSYEVSAMEEIDLKQLIQLCPHALYIRDADVRVLPDSIPISEIEAGSEQASIYKPLLQIAKLSVGNLRDKNPTRRLQKFKRGAEYINKFLQLWTQEKLEAEFVVDQDNLILHITGKEGHFGKLSDRSEGFRWFLSFCLAYGSLTDPTHSSILLLDEPGLHLHASAQKDLLELFELVADSWQIIYTTHSPFMINKNYPERIRSVSKNDRPEGTTVDNKPYRPTKGGYYEPIRASIGLTLGNSLFIGGNNLIVEGIADQILLTAFSRHWLREGNQPFINLQDICITPAGGADNVPYFAYLCQIEDMTSIVLLDNDGESDIAVSRIEREQILPTDRIIRTSEAITKRNKTGVGKNVVELEDLIDQEFYHAAVLQAYEECKAKILENLPKTYAELSSKAISAAELRPDKEPSNDSATARKPKKKVSPKGITKFYSELFKDHEGDGWGHFDKVLVARKISQKLEEGNLPDDKDKTISHFKDLFKKINDKFQKSMTH